MIRQTMAKTLRPKFREVFVSKATGRYYYGETPDHKRVLNYRKSDRQESAKGVALRFDICRKCIAEDTELHSVHRALFLEAVDSKSTERLWTNPKIFTPEHADGECSFALCSECKYRDDHDTVITIESMV
jgi:hypothetical protein